MKELNSVIVLRCDGESINHIQILNTLSSELPVYSCVNIRESKLNVFTMHLMIIYEV